MNKPAKIICLLLIALGFNSYSQDSLVVDEIIAVVGDQIVLKSEVESQVSEFSFTDKKAKWEATCEILKQNIYQKLLVNQAYIDSIAVSDEQVEDQIQRRLNYFITQMRSVEALEKYYEKTITEIKDEMRGPIKDMMLAEGMKDKIIGNYKISPREVKKFYNNLPPDSLPYYNTEVEVAQIVIYVKPDEKEIKKAREKIENLRKRILAGTKFENMAILYSEDEGTATKGGDLEMRSKSDFVPEFAAAAMKLKKDSLSGIVKTKYGFHILKLVDRKGEKVHVKHILMKPKITAEVRVKTKKKLQEIVAKVEASDTFTIENAAFLYSEDENTKNNGGLLFDSESGTSKIPVDKLETTIFFIIDSMEVGQTSEPMIMMGVDGREAYRVVHLKSKTSPHKANLEDDYPKIKELAESYRRKDVLVKWVEKAMKETYITIKPPYATCEELKEYSRKK